MTGYADYLDFYERGPYAPYMKEHRLAGSDPVRLIEVAQPAGRYPDPPMPDIVLALSLRESRCAHVDLGAGRWRGRYATGDIMLWGQGSDTDFLVDDPQHFLLAVLPFEAVRSALGESDRTFIDFGRLHAAPFQDAFTEATVRRLWEEAAESSPTSRLFADAVAQSLALGLLGLSERLGAVPISPPSRQGLQGWRLRRCFDYLNDNLGADIGLDELASAAGLSPVYFARQFKRATGHAPHQYLIRQRVERAKALLAGGDLPIAQIAFECGFSGQEHLTSMFRKVTGTTPAVYRRTVRS